MKVWSFFGLEPSNGSGSQSLGLDKVVLDLMSLLIAVTNKVALLSMVFLIGILLGVLPGVSSSTGLCAYSGGAD